MFSVSAYAYEVNVEWVEPQSYTDVESSYLAPGDEFETLLFERLDRYIERLASMHLEDGQTLNIRITDVNLAGQVQAGLNDRSIVLPNQYPRMTLDYELLDENGNVTQQAQNQEISTRAIRTQGRMNFPRLSRRDRELIEQEARMLNQWFQASFMQN